MLSSTDVIGIDPEAAGENFTDFLESAGLITFWSAIAFWVVLLIAMIAVVKKAGYSGWWAVLGVLLPPLGVVLLLAFALVKWPALKERDEAVKVVTDNNLILPSHEQRAIREAERARQMEEEARRRMERAQADREKADAEHARIQAAQAARQARMAEAAAGMPPARTDEPTLADSKPAADKPERTTPDEESAAASTTPAAAPPPPAERKSTTGTTRTRKAPAKKDADAEATASTPSGEQKVGSKS